MLYKINRKKNKVNRSSSLNYRAAGYLRLVEKRIADKRRCFTVLDVFFLLFSSVKNLR